MCSALAGGSGETSAAGVPVASACSSLGQEQALCRSGAEAWAQETGNRVELGSTPADANERLSLYHTLLAAESQDIDVFPIDVVWPGNLANHFVVLSDSLPPASVTGTDTPLQTTTHRQINRDADP